MKSFGTLLMIFGAIAVGAGFLIDTSISAGGSIYLPERISNLSLMQTQLIVVQVGIGLFIAGAVLCGCGGIIEKLAGEVAPASSPRSEAAPASFAQVEAEVRQERPQDKVTSALIIIASVLALGGVVIAGFRSYEANEVMLPDVNMTETFNETEAQAKESCEEAKAAGAQLSDTVGCEPYW